MTHIPTYLMHFPCFSLPVSLHLIHSYAETFLMAFHVLMLRLRCDNSKNMQLLNGVGDDDVMMTMRMVIIILMIKLIKLKWNMMITHNNTH